MVYNSHAADEENFDDVKEVCQLFFFQFYIDKIVYTSRRM